MHAMARRGCALSVTDDPACGPTNQASELHGTALAGLAFVTKSTAVTGSLVLASAVGLALLLRSKPVARDQLPTSQSMPNAARQVVRSKMDRHDAQMKALISRVVLLDDDGVARVAGEIFDEPAIARPIGGAELDGLIPERFFVLQDELRARARQLVIASGNHDRDAIANEFAAVAKSCVACHEVFVHGDNAPGGAKEKP
jgi:hypothetical protein